MKKVGYTFKCVSRGMDWVTSHPLLEKPTKKNIYVEIQTEILGPPKI